MKAPIEGPPEGEGEEPPTDETAVKAEPPPRPPSPTATEPETDRKTPRMASLRAKMKDRLQKAKVIVWLSDSHRQYFVCNQQV